MGQLNKFYSQSGILSLSAKASINSEFTIHNGWCFNSSTKGPAAQ